MRRAGLFVGAGFVGGGGISVAVVMAANGSALTAGHFGKRRSAGPAQSNQRSLPQAFGPSLRLGVPSLRYPSGGIASGLLRCTSSRCMRLRRTALRASPRMDTFAQPADGAGGSRSRAAGELTLGLLSGKGEAAYRPACFFLAGVFLWDVFVAASLLAMVICATPHILAISQSPAAVEPARLRSRTWSSPLLRCVFSADALARPSKKPRLQTKSGAFCWGDLLGDYWAAML